MDGGVELPRGSTKLPCSMINLCHIVPAPMTRIRSGSTIDHLMDRIKDVRSRQLAESGMTATFSHQ